MSVKVKGKLKADCYVGGVLRKAGEEVEVKAEVAKEFFVEEKKVEKKDDK